MRRFRLALVFGVLLQAIAPAPADALSWWWLDALSGPKFDGPLIEFRLVCFGRSGTGEKRVVASVPGAILSFCNLEPGERRRSSLEANLGLLKSDPNPLFADGQRIDLTMLSVSFTSHLWGPIELGAGIGNSWFSSDALDPFNKLVVEPLRVDFRPGRIAGIRDWEQGSDPWYREVLVLRAGWVIFPAGFSTTELKGERLPAELVFYKGIFLDGEPFIRWLIDKW